jgi:hypothetical protein
VTHPEHRLVQVEAVRTHSPIQIGVDTIRHAAAADAWRLAHAGVLANREKAGVLLQSPDIGPDCRRSAQRPHTRGRLHTRAWYSIENGALAVERIGGFAGPYPPAFPNTRSGSHSVIAGQ